MIQDHHRKLFRGTYYTLRHWGMIHRTDIFAGGLRIARARPEAGLPGRICVDAMPTRVPMFYIQHPGLLRLLTHEVHTEPDGLYLGTIITSAFGERAVQFKYRNELLATLHNTGVSRESCILMLRGIIGRTEVRSRFGQEIARISNLPGWLALIYTDATIEYYDAEYCELLDPRLLIAAQLVLQNSSGGDAVD